MCTYINYPLFYKLLYYIYFVDFSNTLGYNLTNMENIINLIRLGLDEKQAKVYLAGLKTGPTSATVLASISSIKRGTIYAILKELKLLGLCSESKNKSKKIFTMSDPNQLKVIQNDRDNILINLLPTLRSISSNKNIPKISIYDGIDEVKEAYFDTFKNTKEILTLESSDSLFNAFGTDFILAYIEKRKKLKIPARMIAIENDDSKFLKQRDVADMRQSKFIPKRFSIGIDIEVYANKVLLVSISENPFAVMIEDMKIHNSVKNIFEYIWQTL